MSSIDRIIDILPDYFPKDPDTNIHKIIDSISKEVDIADANILYLDNLLEVNTTYGTDLDNIYGNLYSIKRYYGESDNNYRLRLNTAFLSQKGGTSDILQYAIALVLGIDTTNKALMDNAILIEDAWVYDEFGTILPDNNYGCAVCVLNSAYIPDSVGDAIIGYATDTISRCKASGVKFFVIYLSLDIDPTVNINVGLKYVVTDMAQFPITFPTQFGITTEEVL